MAKRGPKFSSIDWDQFARLCFIHATQDEITAVMGISVDTIEREIKRLYKMSYAEFYKQKSSGGKMSLRRAMWNKAIESQDNTMMIYLSKNHLGMTDKNEQTIKQERPSEVKIVWEIASGNQDLFLDKKSNDEET